MSLLETIFKQKLQELDVGKRVYILSKLKKYETAFYSEKSTRNDIALQKNHFIGASFLFLYRPNLSVISVNEILTEAEKNASFASYFNNFKLSSYKSLGYMPEFAYKEATIYGQIADEYIALKPEDRRSFYQEMLVAPQKIATNSSVEMYCMENQKQKIR